MAKVIISIGIPGSGKTTLLKKFAEENGYRYICPDDMRKEFTGDARNHSQEKEVWSAAYKRTAEFLHAGDTVVFDSTFNHPGVREDFLKFVREHGAEKIQGVYFDIPIEISKKRNNARERKVPEEVIDRMHERLKNNPPKLEDGLDSIFRLDENQMLVEAEKTGEGGEIFKKRFRPM